MVYKNSFNKESNIDAGWGLIYRLNYLWQQADKFALEGDRDKWSFTLDRIFCNLSYRNQMEVEIDNNNKVTSIDLSDKDKMIFNKFTDDIQQVKIDLNSALKIKSKLKYDEFTNKHYNLLMRKDIWLRKFMNDLGIYLKESDKNPATAMFGGG